MRTVSYVARLSHCDEAIYVTFPDVPEAHTYGYTKEEALEMAKDALVCWFSDGTSMPTARRLDEFIHDPSLRYDSALDTDEKEFEFVEVSFDYNNN